MSSEIMQIDERKRLTIAYMKLGNPLEEVEMEAYRMKRQRPDDPMASFLDSSNSSLTLTQDRLCLYILLDSCCWLSMEKSVSILIKV